MRSRPILNRTRRVAALPTDIVAGNGSAAEHRVRNRQGVNAVVNDFISTRDRGKVDVAQLRRLFRERHNVRQPQRTRLSVIAFMEVGGRFAPRSHNILEQMVHNAAAKARQVRAQS
jgi:hypothetical protein